VDARKEIKVSIPVELHVKLRSIKLLHGRLIEDQVTDALRAYFAEVERHAPLPAHGAAVEAQ